MGWSPRGAAWRTVALCEGCGQAQSRFKAFASGMTPSATVQVDVSKLAAPSFGSSGGNTVITPASGGRVKYLRRHPNLLGAGGDSWTFSPQGFGGFNFLAGWANSIEMEANPYGVADEVWKVAGLANGVNEADVSTLA